MVKPLSHITFPQHASEFWSWNIVDMWPVHCIKEYKIRFVGRQPWEPDYEPDVWIWGWSESEVHCPDVRTVHRSVQLAAAGPLSQRPSPGQYVVMCRLSCVHVCLHMILTDLMCFQVMHGGLFSRDDVTLDEISKIDRNRQPPEEGKYQHCHQILSILVTTSLP